MPAPLAALTAAGTAAAKAANDLSGALSQLLQPIQALVGPLGVFVDALSPSTMQEFARAMRDLNAVLGLAFQPIVEVATILARELGSVLLPVMRELAPIIAQLGRVVVAVVVPVMHILANVMHSLVPLLQLFADVLSALLPIQQAFQHIQSALLRTVTELLGALFGGTGIKGVMEGFKKAMETLAKMTLFAAAGIARMVGATGFLDNLIKSLQGQGAPKESAEGLAAAQNPAFRSFAEYGRTLDLAALTATAGNQDVKKTEDWLKEAVAELKQISSGQKTASQAILGALKELWDTTIWKALQPYLDRLPKSAREAVDTAEDVAIDTVAPTDSRPGLHATLRALSTIFSGRLLWGGG